MIFQKKNFLVETLFLVKKKTCITSRPLRAPVASRAVGAAPQRRGSSAEGRAGGARASAGDGTGRWTWSRGQDGWGNPFAYDIL